MKLEDRWYTSTEVAQVLGVSLRSVYRYLEEGKLEADIKTATGRHRFTRKNVLDFLYPGAKSEDMDVPENLTTRPDYSQNRDHNRDQDWDQNPARHQNTVTNKYPSPDHKPLVREPQNIETPVYASALNQRVQRGYVPQDPYMSNDDVNTTSEDRAPERSVEPIDWLTKFRQAASRVKSTPAEDSQPQPQSPHTRPEQAPMSFNSETIKGLSNFEYDKFALQNDESPYSSTHASKVPQQKSRREYNETVYYRSSVGGLKDIAQGIDRSARKSFLDYAFTLQAGLSLHKPIRPFSVLHAYVKPKDRSFFERMLGLTPSDEHNAQLALIYTDDESIYSSRREMHGLFVVSDNQLKRDVLSMGDSYLIGEVETVQSR